MKRLLLIVAILAMAGIANAQTGQPCQPADPNICPAGYICNDLGYCSNTNSDPYNCGGPNIVCTIDQDCIGGLCCNGVDDPNCITGQIGPHGKNPPPPPVALQMRLLERRLAKPIERLT